MQLSEEEKSIKILIAQRDEAIKSSDKWFKKFIEVQRKYNEKIDVKNKTIDFLIEILAEERGVSEDDVRSDLNLWN